jgi:aldose sugar dehydrogenase
MTRYLLTGAIALALMACHDTSTAASAAQPSASATADAPSQPGATSRPERPFDTAVVADFDAPWAMTFLPDGRLLVTEKAGKLKLLDPASRQMGEVAGVPEVDFGGQGGLGDVVLHPDFASNGLLYLSYAERGDGETRGAAVARARLVLDQAGGGTLQDPQVIWRQVPKVTGQGHYGHRIAFAPDGMLWISSGERQKFTPAQDMQSNLGKIVRLTDDGGIPADNPFAAQGGVAAQVWSLGHRNILGIAFDAQGTPWAHEMGPKDGDELNRIERGANYGYPIVSEGEHYDGRPIPAHSTQPRFRAPVISWTPVISPAGFVIYSGDAFADWKGDGLIGGLSAKGLVRVSLDGAAPREVARYDFGARIREVEQGPDGAVWLLEDGARGSEGRLLKLTPLR